MCAQRGVNSLVTIFSGRNFKGVKEGKSPLPQRRFFSANRGDTLNKRGAGFSGFIPGMGASPLADEQATPLGDYGDGRDCAEVCAGAEGVRDWEAGGGGEPGAGVA